MNEEREREQESNLPPLPTREEIENEQKGHDFLPNDHWTFVDFTPYKLDFAKSYEAPRYTLSWAGIPFAPLGGIHAITGQAGNGKTMTLAQFMAAILSGGYGQLRYELTDVPTPRVLYIDTEMEEANTIAVKNRVMSMCGRKIDVQYDDFDVIMLREVPEGVDKDKNGREYKVPASVMRWRMVLKAINDLQPTVAFIDGLLDVVADFNDNKECQELIYKCMQVASYFNISVWCCVHQNPGGEKLVGHLGSFLERKVTDVIMTKKDKNATSGDVTFTVSQKKARGRDIQDWQFRVLPVNGWGMPEQVVTPDNNPVAKGKHTADEVRDWFVTYGDSMFWPATLTEIRDKLLKAKCGITHGEEQQAYITMATNRRFIIPQPKDEWEVGQKKPKYYMNAEEFNNEPPF